MKNAASVLLALGLGMASACSVGNGEQEGGMVQPSGSGGARSFAAAGFDKVALQGPDDVW